MACQRRRALSLDRTGRRLRSVVGIALAGSPAVVRTSFVRSNSVGIHVQDAALREEADATEISPGEVIVTTDTTFAGNATKVGSGVLALPDPPATKEP